MPWQPSWCLAHGTDQEHPNADKTQGEIEEPRCRRCGCQHLGADRWRQSWWIRSADGGPMERSIITGFGDLGTAKATSIVGGARISKDWAMPVRQRTAVYPMGKKEPTAAKEVEGWSAAESLQVYGRSRMMTDQGGA
ncbi:hypothetical protein M9458_056155, partial [Cirrhinus mrigala]